MTPIIPLGLRIINFFGIGFVVFAISSLCLFAQEGDTQEGEPAPERKLTQEEVLKTYPYAAGLKALAELMPLDFDSGKLLAGVNTQYELVSEGVTRHMGMVWVLEGKEQESQRLLSLGLIPAGKKGFYGGGKEISYAQHCEKIQSWIENRGMWANGDEWNWQRNGITFGGRELISAAIAWRLGEEALAAEMVGILFEASFNPEHLIDFAIASFAEYELRALMKEFEQTQDWLALSEQLQKLSQKYSRGWIGASSVQILAGKAKQMAQGKMKVESQLPEVTFDEAKLKRIEQLVGGEAENFQLNALFEETADKPLPGGLADVELLLALLGCEAFVPLKQQVENQKMEEASASRGRGIRGSVGIDEDFKLYQSNYQLLNLLSETDRGSYEAQRYYDQMDRPNTYSEMAQGLLFSQMSRYASSDGEGAYPYYDTSSFSGSHYAEALLEELLPLVRKSQGVYGPSRAVEFLSWRNTEDSALDYLMHHGKPEHVQMLVKRFEDDPLYHADAVEKLIVAHGVEVQDLHKKLMKAIRAYEGLDGDELRRRFSENEHYEAQSKAYNRMGNVSYQKLLKWGESLEMNFKELSVEELLEEFEAGKMEQQNLIDMLQKLQRKQGVEAVVGAMLARAAGHEEAQKREQVLEALLYYNFTLSKQPEVGNEQEEQGVYTLDEEAIVADFTKWSEVWQSLLADERKLQGESWQQSGDEAMIAQYAGLSFQLLHGKVSSRLYGALNYVNWEKFYQESLASALASVETGELQTLALPDSVDIKAREALLNEFVQMSWGKRLDLVEELSLAQELALKEIWQEKGASEEKGLVITGVDGSAEFVQQWQGLRGKSFDKEQLLNFTNYHLSLVEQKGQNKQLTGIYFQFDSMGWGGIKLIEIIEQTVENSKSYLESSENLDFEHNQVVFVAWSDDNFILPIKSELDEAGRKELLTQVTSLYFGESGEVLEKLPMLQILPIAKK